MVKIQILIQCEQCKGKAYLPASEAESTTGEIYTRYVPCSQCQGSTKQSQWVTLAEFAVMLEAAKCQHEHTSTRGSFHFITEMVKRGYLPPNTRFWLGDRTEFIWLTVKRAINQLEKDKRLPPDAVDPGDALSTIGLWKSALIPPDRAGSHSSPYLPDVARETQSSQAEPSQTWFGRSAATPPRCRIIPPKKTHFRLNSNVDFLPSHSRKYPQKIDKIDISCHPHISLRKTLFRS